MGRPRLTHVNDHMPGITRRRRGRGFSYCTPDGTSVACAEARARIASLAIPPAWRDVWICVAADGHIQATGIDGSGRKQYLYHPDWSRWRAEVKFAQLPDFGMALPRIRRRVEKDLEAEPGTIDFSIAALIMLLDRAHLRVGSRRHTARSRTYGATTLLRQHVRLGDDGTVRLNFLAKGGKRVRRSLRDKRLHRILQSIDDLPGRNLFTWMDEAGGIHAVTSGQVNDWLADAAGVPDITAKTFRTWAGSVAALAAAAQPGRIGVATLTKAAAERLHNTPAVCRKAYIHPQVLELAEMEEEARMALLSNCPPTPSGLRADERRLVGLLTR